MSDLLDRLWRPTLRAPGWLQEVGLLLIGLVLAAWFNASLTLNYDVSWYYYVGQKLLGGAVLYKDLIEPNAPFAALSILPAAWLGQVTGLSPFATVLIYVGALGLTAFLISARILDRYGLPAGRSAWLKLLLFGCIFFLPGGLFGEREHLFCIFTLPYVLGIPLRDTGGRRFDAGRFCIGLAAGIAVNLKPPFALIVAAAEGFSLLVAGRRGLLCSEQLGLAAAVCLAVPFYALAFPLYATTVLPWVVDLYGAYGKVGDTLRKAAEWGGLAAAMFVAWGRDENRRLENLRRLMLLVAGVALLIFVLQNKGWDYQVFITTFYAAVLAGAAAQAPTTRRPARMVAILAASVLALRVGALAESPDYVQYHFSNIRRLVEKTKGSFLVLTSAGTPGFPYAVETGHEWASRYACLMMLPGIVAAEAHGEHSRWEAPFRAAIAEDMAAFKPSLVIVQNEQLPGLPADFNLLAWLLRDPSFAAAWSAYRSTGTVDLFFTAYVRR